MKLQIIIVRDVWLTGIDNLALHTLYVDKAMSGYNLIQAINRVATKNSRITIDTVEAFECTKEVAQNLQSLFTHIFARLLNSPPLEGAGGGQNPILLPKP